MNEVEEKESQVKTVVKGLEATTNAFTKGLGDAMAGLYAQAIGEVTSKCGCLIPRVEELEKLVNQFNDQLSREKTKGERTREEVKSIVAIKDTVTKILQSVKDLSEASISAIKETTSQQTKTIQDAGQKELQTFKDMVAQELKEFKEFKATTTKYLSDLDQEIKNIEAIRTKAGDLFVKAAAALVEKQVEKK